MSFARAIVAACTLLVAGCATWRTTSEPPTRGELLRGYASAPGVNRSGEAAYGVLPIALFGGNRMVVVHSSRQNWREKIADVRSLSDDRVLLSKVVPVHALNTGGADTIMALRVRPGGNEVVFGASTGELLVWNLRSNDLRYLPGIAANRVIYSMDFLPNGHMYIHDSNHDHHIEIWDIDAGRRVAELDDAQSVTQTRDHNLVVARQGAFDEIDGRNLRLLHRYPRIDEHAVQLAALPDGRILEQAYSGTIRLWDLKAARVRAAPPLTIRASDENWSLHATWHDDGYVLTSTGSHEQPNDPCAGVCAWSVVDGSLTVRIATPGHRAVAAFLPLPGHRVATMERDGTTIVWDLRSGKPMADYPTLLAGILEN